MLSGRLISSFHIVESWLNYSMRIYISAINCLKPRAMRSLKPTTNKDLLFIVQGRLLDLSFKAKYQEQVYPGSFISLFASDKFDADVLNDHS